MLQDLFASMLGFTGDIIIDTGLTFRVRDGISLHRESERYSINIIAPLGWHYVHLNKLFEKYRSNWSLHRDEGCELYKTAVVSAIDDILHEYVEDVSYMEQYFSSDGSAPLSVIIQHFQKVCSFSASTASRYFNLCLVLFFQTVFISFPQFVASSY